MYYITEDFKQLIRNLGGEWNDQKKRPIVCLMQSTEHPDLLGKSIIEMIKPWNELNLL